MPTAANKSEPAPKSTVNTVPRSESAALPLDRVASVAAAPVASRSSPVRRARRARWPKSLSASREPATRHAAPASQTGKSCQIKIDEEVSRVNGFSSDRTRLMPDSNNLVISRPDKKAPSAGGAPKTMRPLRRRNGASPAGDSRERYGLSSRPAAPLGGAGRNGVETDCVEEFIHHG